MQYFNINLLWNVNKSNEIKSDYILMYIFNYKMVSAWPTKQPCI